MTQRFYVTVPRKQALTLLDYLMNAESGVVDESLTDTLKETWDEAAKADAHCIIIVEKGDL